MTQENNTHDEILPVLTQLLSATTFRVDEFSKAFEEAAYALEGFRESGFDAFREPSIVWVDPLTFDEGCG